MTTGDRDKRSALPDFLHHFKITRWETETISIAYVRKHAHAPEEETGAIARIAITYLPTYLPAANIVDIRAHALV